MTELQVKTENWKVWTKEVSRLESEYKAAVDWKRRKLGEAVQARRALIEAEERQMSKQDELKEAHIQLVMIEEAMREELG